MTDYQEKKHTNLFNIFMGAWEFSKENEDPKKPLAPKLTAFDTEDNKLWRHEKTEGLGLGGP